MLSIGTRYLSVINGEVVVQDGRFKTIDLPVFAGISSCVQGHWSLIVQGLGVGYRTWS